jgi:farnesyl diphosphate synthase
VTTPPRLDGAAFAALLAATGAQVDTTLDRILSAAPQDGEPARPAALIEAMRYGALASGKRLRPFLVVETARALGHEGDGALRAGAAIECLHAYSLIHDDLPAMDDDDLRRGRPTTHKVYGEALAILAGDGLQALAFEVLADPRTSPDPAVRAALCLGLARNAGLAGMVGGQSLDMAAETRADAPTDEEVRVIQAMKTGALLRFSVEAGAILGGASPSVHQALKDYGRALGAAFQIADDLLDAEGTAATVGKRTGKDAERNKPTFVRALGLEGARKARDAEVAAALRALDAAALGASGAWLAQAALFVAERNR